MAAKRKSAIEARQGHPEGFIDDATKWLYDRFATTYAKKGAKAFNKMVKTADKAGGSIRKSVVPSENTPNKLVRQYERQSKAFKKSYAKSDIYSKKAGRK